MRVLLCHNNYTVQGGAEVFVHEVARVLRDNGHSVAFLAADEKDSDVRWKQYFPASVDDNTSKVAAITQFPKMVYSVESKRAAERIIDEFKPDLVHCFAIYTKLTPSILDVFRAKGVPVVCSFNDYKHICPNYKLFHHGKLCESCRGKHFWHAAWNRCAHDSLLYSTAAALESYAHRVLDIYRKNVRVFLFASEYMAQKTRQFWGQHSFRSEILRNPFDASSYPMQAVPGDYALYFGRLIDEKGVDILVKAAAIAADVPVVVVGDGPDRGRLEKLNQELDCRNVDFVGEKWGKDLDQILAACRYVVVPSLWHENFPYVILQAFAMGKPVLGSNRGGIPELVENGERGIVYDAEDEHSLARHMNALHADDTEVRRLGKNAKQYVDEEFNDNRFYDRLMDIYTMAVA